MGELEIKIEEICKNLGKQQQELFLKAFNFAKNAHKNQKRKSTDIPFIYHPASVAISLWEKYKNLDLTLAAFLHDTVEDCETVSICKIHETFGTDVCFLVDSVTKNKKDFHHVKEVFFDEKIERFLWAGFKDIRCLILKIADRSHNLETLDQLKDHKQVRMAFETQAIYQPLRKILSYDEGLTLKQSQTLFDNFLTNEKINTPSQLKKHLYNCTFKNFTHSTFDFVYRNSNTIIWKIDDIETYRMIRSSDAYKEKIEFLSVTGNNANFQANFKFIKGAIDENAPFSLELASFRT